ncbi:MAG: GlsB/YeaQ/YmgE family stress response membrane protein [Actinomycetia bacterium]|nr:GlsB/YeaQ/YmgE family stress response membrane protein [Actinomycetes bacterium]MCP3910954.1 GlsB/YeaQ/YmgE family stress response membrane protein [Actinomycetes bacterium]MCP4086444.1 GlsB/YeaQ/YmgE family stress response membrane protein [Actinomycetes bacterium]
MLLLAILAAGMAVGAVAQLIMGTSGYRINWTVALVAGVGGSLVGGLLISFLAGDGLALRPSGLIGSLVGAVLLTAGAKRMQHL